MSKPSLSLSKLHSLPLPHSPRPLSEKMDPRTGISLSFPPPILPHVSTLGEQLFYILGACYTLLFLFISLILRSAPLGLANWGTRPERVVGWLSFVAIESYGSLAVALFWAFTNATVDLEAAKASYGLVIAGAQIGAIIGMYLN